jgi:hypothetical protein
MKRVTPGILLLGLLAADAASAAPALRRFALVAGANRGAADRLPLRYAVLDAERFAEVVTRMGGVSAADRIVLREPTRQAFLEALGTTSERASQAMSGSQRVEVLVYFSGHADDRGLMLGPEVLPYTELRRAMGAISAHVGITILDACASGAITRIKGGQSHPAFLSDVSHVVQGYAFLASSSETEAAQESERLRGSFFTHALLTGLRGAADASGDGKVTLNEAYQFAFQETLVQTAATQGGAQHPTYDIKMAGTGDVVMTDVRQTSSSLVLGEDYEGRFLVLNARRHLVAELFKARGRQVELALEPGAYEVYYEERPQVLRTSLTMADGQRQELARAALKPTARLPTGRRGGDPDGDGTPRRGASPFGLRLSGESFGPNGDGLGFRPRVEFVFQPLDRLSLRPQVGFGWRTNDVSLILGANAAYHFRPGKRWRPFLGGGITWENRHAPVYDTRCCPELRPSDPPPELFQDVLYAGLSAGIERAMSRRWSFLAELEYSPYSWKRHHWNWNGHNWYGTGGESPLSVTVGFTFNITPGRKEPLP